MLRLFPLRSALVLLYAMSGVAAAQSPVDSRDALSPLVFQVSYYKQTNNLSKLTDAQAQADWLATGLAQGRRAHPLYWGKQYLAYYPDLQAAFGNDYGQALTHYVEHGHAEGRTGVLALASEVFDIQFYRATNPAQASLSDDDAETYWVLQGIAAHQQAHPRFYAPDYLFLNYDKVLAFGPDGVAAAVDDYPLNGAPQSRLALLALAPQVFDPTYYAAHHPEAQSDPATYWLKTGLPRGDKASTIFSAVEYLGQYPDLVTAFGAHAYGQAIRHYMQTGRSEGRSGLYSIDQSYLALVPTAVPPSAGLQKNPNDRLEQFTSVTGQLITVTIQAPHPASSTTYTMRPIGQNETADSYFPTAVANATAAHAGTLLIPAGTYTFQGSARSNSHWEIDSASDLTIDGQGSTLNFTRPEYGILLNSPTRLLLKNFTLDWPQLPIAALGTVVAGPGGQNRLQMSAAYAFDGNSPVLTMRVWDLANNRWSRANDNESYYNSAGATGPAYQGNGIYTSPDFASFPLGTVLLLRYYLTGAALVATNSQDIALENVRVASTPAFGFLFSFGRGFRISNCMVDRVAGRLISSATDALHLNDISGDVLVENSTFAHQGDDGMNLGPGSLLPVQGIQGTSVVFQASDFVPKVNDPLLFYNSALGLLGTSTVQSATPSADGSTISVQLKTAVPYVAGDSWAEDLNLMAARWIVRNNQFIENRARAILPQSPYGLIEGNTMTGQTASSMIIGTINDVPPAAGPGVQDLQVINNNISNAGDQASAGQGAIQISSWLTNGLYDESGSTDVSVNQNIVVAGNVIQNVPGPGIFLGSAANVTLSGNQITNSNSGATYLLGTASTSGGIVVSQAHNIAITNAGAVSVDSHSTSAVTVKAVGTAPAITGIANGASFMGSVAPGSLATLAGSGLTSTSTSALNTPLPTNLAGVSVLVNNRAAPLLYVSSSQINFQMPHETPIGTASVQVTAAAGSSTAFSVNVVPAAPGVFAYNGNHAVAQNADGSLNGPGHAAAPGSYLVVYLTGQGSLDNAVATGAAAPATPLSRAMQPASATIGGVNAPVLFFGLAPGFVGVGQVNVTVPSLGSGDYPLVLSAGGAVSAPVLVTVGK